MSLHTPSNLIRSFRPANSGCLCAHCDTSPPSISRRTRTHHGLMMFLERAGASGLSGLVYSAGGHLQDLPNFLCPNCADLLGSCGLLMLSCTFALSKARLKSGFRAGHRVEVELWAGWTMMWSFDLFHLLGFFWGEEVWLYGETLPCCGISPLSLSLPHHLSLEVE